VGRVAGGAERDILGAEFIFAVANEEVQTRNYYQMFLEV
jgi:hypothetical protein